MYIALLRIPLSESEIDQLKLEFPQFIFVSYPDSRHPILPEYWGQVEILFGDKISPSELEMAPSLKWIHSPTSQLNKICLSSIELQGNVLVTCTREENAQQIGEFISGIILAYAKNLFHWKEAQKFPSLLWDAKWRQSMWTLKGKEMLQIGMGKAGIEIARIMNDYGVNITSIDKEGSFHPYCKRNKSLGDLERLLPSADIVSIELPRETEFRDWFGLKELSLMKEDSILSLRGPSSILEVDADKAVSHFEKLRGGFIDASYQIPLSSSSPLWKIPHLLITPDVAARPKTDEREAFRLFRTNLRDYIHNNFQDMKDLVNTAVLFNDSIGKC